MKIRCQKSDLLNSVNIVLKAVPTKTTMPILECLIIEANNYGIKLIANDMELGIETMVKGTIMEEGIVALNAKVFSEIVRRLPENEVYISVDENYTTEIICEKAKFAISGRSGDEFPSLQEVERENPLTLSQFTLKEVIRQTVFSISDNESNKIMTGELFDIKNNELRVISLDGHRISIRKIIMKEEYEERKVIIPGKTLNEISKILSGEVDSFVNIFFTDKHALFEFDDTLVVTRLIDGEYYRIDQMLSSDYETKVTINKKELLSCIERASLLIRENDKKPIIIRVSDNNFELNINTSLGSMKEDVDIVMEGKDIVIGFNPKFLMDALRVIDDETVDIYLINPKAPCFIRDKEQSYIYLILPVNINVGA
ncbi:DNA polymerase III subunit beta [Herbinix luporum]|jgi:DNA polymerase-3 subunit beta|uniref:DNA polymerase III subunit beta n=1 Tax=Herbinix luporum TaxID=1679721 RepID=UPI001761278F|nr:DNA polymerase III subunit beta [Herbinix luporum]HHT57759.1 DNA polymerase III subunit beta [Herbinix luporum]